MKTVLPSSSDRAICLECTAHLMRTVFKMILISSISILLLVNVSYAKPTLLPDLPLKGWLLMDAETGSVLAEVNGHELLEPASITKIMSSYIVADAIQKKEISMDDKVVISEKARQQEGSRMFVEQNSKITVLDLMRGMIIHSGNDSTVALSEHVSGSEDNFVRRMNAMATKLELKSTHFENSTGLPVSNHLTTAYDIALLSRHLIYDHPDIYKMYSEKTFTWNKIKQENRNRLLFSDPTVDGIKTGHTNAAGYCLVSSSIRNNFRLIAVVLGGKKEADRYKASQDLLAFGYKTFTKQKIYAAQQAIGELPLLEGKKDSVPFGLKQDLNLAFDQNRYQDIQAEIKFKGIKAPVVAGSEIGQLILTLDDKILFTAPVLALESIDQTNFVNIFLSRFKTRAIAKFKKMIG